MLSIHFTLALDTKESNLWQNTDGKLIFIQCLGHDILRLHQQVCNNVMYKKRNHSLLQDVAESPNQRCRLDSHRADLVCCIHECRTMVRLQMLRTFNGHTDINAHERTQGLCEHHYRVCTKRWLWKETPCCMRESNECPQHTGPNAHPAELYPSP